VLKERISIKNITFQMKDTAKKLNSKIRIVKHTFLASKITQYLRLVLVADFVKKQTFMNNKLAVNGRKISLFIDNKENIYKNH